jgi:FkbM family methyltransferase
MFARVVGLISLLTGTESSLLFHHNSHSRLLNLTTEHLRSSVTNVLDIGAHRGQWTDMLRRFQILNQGSAILIDGNRDYLTPQDSRDIRISEIVGDSDGVSVEYYLVKENDEGNSLYPQPIWFFKNAEVEIRQSYTIDSLLKAIKKEQISFDLIYFDLQGSELKALKGSKQTLSQVGSGIVIVKVAVRQFPGSSAPSFLDIQLEMYRQDFVMISIVQYYHVTRASTQEDIITHMDIAFQHREHVTWLGGESWERRDYDSILH